QLRLQSRDGLLSNRLSRGVDHATEHFEIARLATPLFWRADAEYRRHAESLRNVRIQTQTAWASAAPAGKTTKRRRVSTMSSSSSGPWMVSAQGVAARS